MYGHRGTRRIRNAFIIITISAGMEDSHGRLLMSGWNEPLGPRQKEDVRTKFLTASALSTMMKLNAEF